MPDKISGRECQSEPLSPTESNGIDVFPFLFFVLQSMYCMYLGLKKKNVGGFGPTKKRNCPSSS